MELGCRQGRRADHHGHYAEKEPFPVYSITIRALEFANRPRVSFHSQLRTLLMDARATGPSNTTPAHSMMLSLFWSIVLTEGRKLWHALARLNKHHFKYGSSPNYRHSTPKMGTSKMLHGGLYAALLQLYHQAGKIALFPHQCERPITSRMNCMSPPPGCVALGVARLLLTESGLYFFVEFCMHHSAVGRWRTGGLSLLRRPRK
ncbi:hypothetical protein IF1G_01474 [Cordyceps javanica]|uniref:Uncharacterized protein n=1 Tax=Cordyceps javanica TaxID=43265 RepID=A0A545VCB7_9HYPO|nr:hypothetical protein IF1G_01474 [Cordyceps javanica]